MAKKIDPVLIEILTKYGEKAEDALWDCHGVWVAYHKAIERIAAKAGVVFDMPQIIEANSEKKTVAIAVIGKLGDKSEWSFGEAAPANNKNSYPYAMAEKRAKDRVVLKLIGLHGLVYSEEESDDFKAPATEQAKQLPSPPTSGQGNAPSASKNDDARNLYSTLETAMRMATTKAELRAWWQVPTNVSARNRLTTDWQSNLREEFISLGKSLPEGHEEKDAA
jgi:hypothetical protein